MNSSAGFWMLIVLILVGTVGASVWNRDFIMTRLPASEYVYNLVGLGLEPPGAGLQLLDVQQNVMTRDGKRVVKISGFIVNISDRTRPVPQLVAVIYDRPTQGAEIMRQKFPPPLPKLLIKERVPFVAELVDPPEMARRIKVTFDTTKPSRTRRAAP